MTTVRILTGNVLAVLPTLPVNSVHCCVTSPPYWGLRDYGTATWEGGDLACDHRPGGERRVGKTTLQGGNGSNGHKQEGYRDICSKCGAQRVDAQLGLEAIHDCLGWATGQPCGACYVCHLVAVFREVRRVLRPDGVCFLNLGDSYNGSGGAGGDYAAGGMKAGQPKFPGRRVTGLKDKDLVMIPARVALALQADGWYLRSDIIWAKPNPMPESVTDRPTKAHEYIFLLTKSARYFYDAEAVRESGGNGWHCGTFTGDRKLTVHPDAGRPDRTEWPGRNRRTVWTVPTSPYPEAHFATYPPKLVEPCILAGTSEYGCCPTCGAPWVRVVEHTDEVDATAKGSRFDQGKTGVNGNGRTQPGERFVKVATGWRATCDHNAEPVPCTVLDPFLGSGTTAQVAVQLGRNALGIELNPEYVALARRRIAQTLPLLQEPTP